MKNRTRTLTVVLLLLLPGLARADWDFERRSVPLDEIVAGGPPKDGIPALTDPAYLPGDEADWLEPDERVLGVSLHGVARAYPTRILSWHELVNDTVREQPILVSW